jgi:hypothetical protein
MILVGLLAGLWALAARADNGPQQVWLISSRQAPCEPSACGGETRLGYWLLGPGNQWVPASLDAFLATDSAAVPTVIFIHGNRVDADRAVCDGRLVLGPLTAAARGRPFRFVFFSWPADRLSGGPREDAQCKALRSDAQSYYLAWLMNRMHAGTPVDLIGFSFGARVITGALEMLGGGCVAGQVLADRTPGHGPIRVMLVAAALDSDWLLPTHRDGLALGQVERMLVSVDPVDRALHFYPRLYGRGGPEALGACGPDCPEQLGPRAAKIELVNVECEVGKVHDWNNYASACSLASRLGWYAFLP